jgi:hypothetical protein
MRVPKLVMNKLRVRLLVVSTAIGLITTVASQSTFERLLATYSGDAVPWSPVISEVSIMTYRSIDLVNDTISYSNMPSSLDLSYLSISALQNQTVGLGNLVSGVREGDYVDHVRVVLVTWAKAADWPEWAQRDPVGYSQQITIGFFSPRATEGGGVAFDFIGEGNAWIEVPWRPLKLENGNPYPHNGYAFVATVAFSSAVKLPAEYAVLVSYNTSTTGYRPLGNRGPYDSLNFGCSTQATKVGVDLDPDAVLWAQASNWYYPAKNWRFLGSPMIEVATRSTPSATGWTSNPPINTGIYQVRAQSSNLGLVEATGEIEQAVAMISIADQIRSKDDSYEGPKVTTLPEGLAYRTRFGGGTSVPNVVGKYPISVEIEDMNYRGDASAELVVTGPNYRDWLRVQAGVSEPLPAEFGFANDADGDGIPNSVEYALGTDPTAQTPNPLVDALKAPSSFTLWCPRDLPEAVLGIEESHDIESWIPILPTRVTIDGERQGMVLSISPGNSERYFLRFRVDAAH